MYRVFHNTWTALSNKQKEKYRGVFETQKSGDKTSSGKIGLDIRTHASPKVGQDQVSGGVSVLCWHAAEIRLELCELVHKQDIALAFLKLYTRSHKMNPKIK